MMYEDSYEVAPEAEVGISDFMLSLTIPDALNPDGWFCKLPKEQQAAIKGCSLPWHYGQWLLAKATYKKPMH